MTKLMESNSENLEGPENVIEVGNMPNNSDEDAVPNQPVNCIHLSLVWLEGSAIDIRNRSRHLLLVFLSLVKVAIQPGLAVWLCLELCLHGACTIVISINRWIS